MCTAGWSALASRWKRRASVPGEDRNLVLGENLILWSAAALGSAFGEDRNNQDFAAAAVDATAAQGVRARREL
jgi:hypothetical protein